MSLPFRSSCCLTSVVPAQRVSGASPGARYTLSFPLCPEQPAVTCPTRTLLFEMFSDHLPSSGLPHYKCHVKHMASGRSRPFEHCLLFSCWNLKPPGCTPTPPHPKSLSGRGYKTNSLLHSGPPQRSQAPTVENKTVSAVSLPRHRTSQLRKVSSFAFIFP